MAGLLTPEIHNISEKLFLDADDLPIRFCLVPCQVKRRLKPIIEVHASLSCNFAASSSAKLKYYLSDNGGWIG
jgi:hypothetical protein